MSRFLATLGTEEPGVYGRLQPSDTSTQCFCSQIPNTYIEECTNKAIAELKR